jgi:hypothetical protein
MCGVQFGLLCHVILLPTSEYLHQLCFRDQVSRQTVDNLPFQCIAATMQHTPDVSGVMIMIQHSLSRQDGFTTQGTQAFLMLQ